MHLGLFPAVLSVPYTNDDVAALIHDGVGLTWTYDSGAGTLTGNVGDLTVSEFSSPNISQWTNDAGYVTSSALTGYVPYSGATAPVDLGIYGLGASTGSYTGVLFGTQTSTATNNPGLFMKVTGTSRYLGFSADSLVSPTTRLALVGSQDSVTMRTIYTIDTTTGGGETDFGKHRWYCTDVEKMQLTASQLYVEATTDATSSTDGAIRSAGGLSLAKAAYIGTTLKVAGTTVSSDPSTGAGVISGGLGVGGAANISGATKIYDTTASSSPTTGALIVSGGLGVNLDIRAGGILQSNITTDASSLTTGSGIFAGGVGISKKLYVGTGINLASLTASQAVVTDSSKNLISLAYATANTASALVQRDASGNFNAGSVTVTRLTTSSTGSVYNVIESTTTGSTNAGTLYLRRGDQTNGYATLELQTAGISKWLFGMTPGSDVYRFYDSTNGVNQFTLTPGAGSTGIASFAGQVNVTDYLSCSSFQSTVGNGIQAGIFTANAANATGLLIYPFTASGTADGARLYIKKTNTLANGFSFGYNGSVANAILNWPATSYCITRHNGNGNGTVSLSILEAGGMTVSEATTFSNSTASTTTGTGAIICSGGVGIAGNLNVGGTITGNLSITNDAADTTCYLTFVTASGTQALPLKTNTGLIYNASTNAITATTFSGALSGNATTATTLQTARNIGGVSFNGSANIVPQTIESANESSDTTCFPLFVTASGTVQLQPKNNTSFTFNASTGNLGVTSLNINSAAAYACRAWVNFDGTGTPAIRASQNVSSISDNGTGKFGINLTNAQPDANYSVVSFCRNEIVGGDMACNLEQAQTPTSSAYRIATGRSGTGFVDPVYVCSAIFR